MCIYIYINWLGKVGQMLHFLCTGACVRACTWLVKSWIPHCTDESMMGNCSHVVFQKKQISPIFLQATTWKGSVTTHVRSSRHQSWLEDCKHHLPSDGLRQSRKLMLHPYSHQCKKSQLWMSKLDHMHVNTQQCKRTWTQPHPTGLAPNALFFWCRNPAWPKGVCGLRNCENDQLSEDGKHYMKNEL